MYDVLQAWQNLQYDVLSLGCSKPFKLDFTLFRLDFLRLFLTHVRDLLEKQYEFATGQWVKTDAAKASNMKQSETLR